MSSSNLFRPRINGAVPTLQMAAINGGLDRRTSVISMNLAEPFRSSANFLNQQPSKDVQEALAVPDMMLKHGRISGLTWWCTFKDSQLERLYRKFFYLDAHFHFQFLGFANIVWDMIQILIYFVYKKYLLVSDPITISEYNNYTCRSTICYETLNNSNISTCDIEFVGHDHPLTPHPRDFPFYKYGALPRLIIHIISLLIFGTLALVWQLDRHPPTRRRRAYALLLWLILCVINYSFFAINPYRVPDDEVGFTQFIIFMTYTLIPVPLFWSLGLAVLLSVFHMCLVIIIFHIFQPHIEEEVYVEIFATIFILLAANLNGFYHNTLYELSARRTFLTIRDSAKASILINNQYEKIKYLLLSIMPKYFYLKYDMCDKNFAVTDATEQNSNFKMLHVDHMEAVSILFADVVGFTKLSSSMDARELVELLNDLFGQFDDLAKNNNCLRIKILGDCYYCVSGVPDPISDHADNCVKMGLDMCNTIKRFQRSTSPDLNMRVGVHSGHVFSGILGSKKFQFDIWSTDVTIANHMESGGVAGWVHISEATKRHLKADFTCYNGNGVERDTFLRTMNIKTYFIKPEEHVTRSPRFLRSRFKSTAVPFGKHSIDLLRNCTTTRLTERRATIDSVLTEGEDTLDKQIKEKIEESLNRTSKQQQADTPEKKIRRDTFSIVDTHSDLNPYFLYFNDISLEKKFHNVPDKSFKYYIFSSWIVHLSIFIVQMIVHTSAVAIYFFIGGTIVMAVLDSFYWLYLLQYADFAPFKSQKVREGLAFFSDKIVGNIFVRYLVSVVVIVIVMASATINLSTCCEVGSLEFRKTLCDFNQSLSSAVLQCPAFNEFFNESKNQFVTNCVKCQNPQYFIYNAILAMLVPSMFIGLNWIFKAVMNVFGFFLYVGLYLTFRSFFNQWDLRHSGVCTNVQAYVPLIERGIYWMLIEFLALVLFERVIERTNRIGFIWRHHSIIKNEEHQLARDDHTHLLHNILPSHVAEHYLHDATQGELYSNRHPNACVMFASIPGFDTLYSEDDINHMGMEWLRLLNEMFHEFDMLLEQPEFAGVEKIKTIGSTYMAATGLKESDTVNDYHIYTMALFSFALREKLKEISYNALNDFEFKIGINTGPVVAGVICAEKPLFDIWGDTVNVASRMESTGATGETQVTKNVEIALTRKSLQLRHKGAVFCKGKGELEVYLLITPQEYNI